MKDFEFRNLIEEVREKTDMVQVIGQRIPLDNHHRALCPFHGEKTPSFTVNTEGQYFHCFGCGLGGDVFTFLELYEKKSFMEVLNDLAKQAGIAPVSISPEDEQQIEEDRIIGDTLTKAAWFYHKGFSQEARDYLIRERGFSDEIISRFVIGFAKGGLREHLIDVCKLPVDLCLKAGVLKKTDNGEIRDYFFNRIIFPNLKRGKVVHLSGRVLGDQKPKYLHLPGEIKHLYNEDALSNKEVLVTEGIPDCISAVKEGYPAVAILGSFNFKPDYLQRFSRCERIYLCLDGDKAGKIGALKTGEIIGERARIVQLPEGIDLNDYLKNHSKEDFDALVNSSKDLVRYELDCIPADIDRTELPQVLDPVLKRLAQMEKAKIEAYLRYEIKPRYELKKEDIDGYRELVTKYRKAEADAEQTNDPDVKPVYSALFDGLVDLVEHEGNSAFLIKDEDKLCILTQIEHDGTLYVPPPREQIPWLLPRGEEIIKLYELQRMLSQKESDAALYDDLLSYHKGVSEFPDEKYYDLIVAWDFHTYLLEAVQYSPIICLFAVPERGKSRTGKGIIHIAYRGIHVESLRDAYLVRVSNDLGASLFFDVKDIWKKAEKNGSEDILLHRFEKGAKVPRVLFPDKGAHKDIVYYSIFGPTLIGTNEGIHRILETRSVPINMPETKKRFENDVTPEISLPLKERLIAFRAGHLGERLPDIPKPTSGRLGDILKPLQQIIRLVKPEREPHFLQLVRELEADRLIEKGDSIEAQILMVLIELKEEVERGILPVKTITDAFNEEKSDKYKVTYQRVGRRLSAMGFKKCRAHDGASAIIWNEESIERMKDTYGLKKTSETSDRSETSAPQPDVTGVSDDTDVSRRLF